jgi:hypothetical protein
MINKLNLIFILVFIMSCGIDKDRSSGRSPATLGQEIELEGDTLSSVEQSIAVRICFAYRSKRSRFSTTSIGDDFNFNIEHTQCSGEVIEEDIATKLRQNNVGLFFDTSYSGEFYEKVETDIDGILKSVCTNVLKGESSANSFEVNNSTHAISFSTSRNIDSYQVQIAQKTSSSTEELVVQIIDFEVPEKNSSNPYYGATTSVKRTIACQTGSSRYDIITKKLLSN